MKNTMFKHQLIAFGTVLAISGCSSIPYFGDDEEEPQAQPQSMSQPMPSQENLEKQQMTDKIDALSAQLNQINPSIAQLKASASEQQQQIGQLNAKLAKQDEMIKSLNNRPSTSQQGNALMPGYGLQLFSLSNQRDIKSTWNELARKHPQILASLHVKYETITIKNKQYYRVKAGKFNSRDAAIRACDQLRVVGTACLPTNFNGTNL
jgi:TolA-binding protein